MTLPHEFRRSTTSGLSCYVIRSIRALAGLCGPALLKRRGRAAEAPDATPLTDDEYQRLKALGYVGND
ncbi:MAG: hypothetical protein V2A79_17035 [Planctomycetota bacterium]